MALLTTTFLQKVDLSWLHKGPVHTYPDILESATFSFQIWLPSTPANGDSESGKNKSAHQSGKNISATNPITCGRVDIFDSDDVKSVSSLSPNNKSGERCKFNATISLYGACSEEHFSAEEPWSTRLSPYTTGYAWTGEFDLNMLCVDGEILNPERKSCGFKNIRIRVDFSWITAD